MTSNRVESVIAANRETFLRGSAVIAFALLLINYASGALAQRLTPAKADSLVAAYFDEAGVTPAPLCSNERFLRRITLDLAGRIPTLEEQARFLEKPDRIAKINELLVSEEFPEFWSNVWTGMLVGYGEGYRSERESLRLYLQQSIREAAPYDAMAKRMLTTTGPSAIDGAAGYLARHRDEPMVQIARSFLGVRIDCARCHDHPFDRWTQDDFQRLKRFFDATEIRQVSDGNYEMLDREADRNPENAPRFLTGSLAGSGAWRQEFALFTVRSKPFARAFANHVWCQLMGRGIVHPPDDLNKENPPANPQLLDALATFVQESQFDLRALVRLICATEAYQRESVAVAANAEVNRVFAAKPIKPLTGEQLFDSMAVALGPSANSEERQRFVMMYASEGNEQESNQPWIYSETVQALMQRLNSPVNVDIKDRNELFERLLCRKPTEKELAICQSYTMRDVAFALLYGNEFSFNH